MSTDWDSSNGAVNKIVARVNRFFIVRRLYYENREFVGLTVLCRLASLTWPEPKV